MFDLLIQNFNLGYIFWMVSTRALAFHISDPYDKNFMQVPKELTLTLVFDLLVKNFNLGCNFWMVSTRALIFHMSIPCDKNFL